MKHRLSFLAAALLFAAAHRTEADPLPPAWPLDGVPASWTNLSFDWKATWQETLAANYDTNALKDLVRTNIDPASARELDPNGWITVWLVAGPYRMEGLNSSELFDVPFEPEKSGNAPWKTAIGMGDTPWRIQFRDMHGENRVAYLRTSIWSPKAQDVRVEFGSNDGIKSWLNGTVFHSNNTFRTWSDCQDVVSVRLKEGWNTLMLKITQYKGPWEASTRIRTPDNSQLAGVRLWAGLRDEQGFRVRHIVLLDALMRRFPGEKGKHPQAMLDIAGEFLNLGDRTRALQWYRKIIEDVPARPDLAATAADEILRNAQSLPLVPDARAWIRFAAAKIRDLEKTSPASIQPATLELAARLSCQQLSDEQRYPELLRLLDSLQGKWGSELWWLHAQIELTTKSGLFARAADLYSRSGDERLAATVRDRTPRLPTDDPAARPSRELLFRWRAMQDKAQAAGGDSAVDTADAQEVLKLSAESGAMNAADPDNRFQFWIAVDRLLADAPPVDLQPLRDLEEQKARSAAAEFRHAGDMDGLMRLFRRHPWARSVHERLAQFGEQALREGHLNTALRFFQDVITHAADPDLQAQARVGLWLTLAQEAGSRAELDKAMTAVPDAAPLPWHGAATPARDVKKAIRAMAAPDAALPADLAAIRRRPLHLPLKVAADNPLTPNRLLMPWNLGPWALTRIDAAGERISVAGPRTLSCFDAGAPAARWFNVEPGLLCPDDDQDDLDPLDRHGLNPVSRAPITGSPLAPAMTSCRDAHAEGTTAGRILCALVDAGDSVNSTSYLIAAFDADSGRDLWSTRENPDWQDLNPLSAPTASDGRVYAVAIGPDARGYRPVYLICMNGDDGAIAWKRRMASVPAGERNSQMLALAGSPVTVCRGSIYVSTDLGLAGRFDVRDGMVEWIQSYTNSAGGSLLRSKFRREGPSPVIAGDTVIVAPRDHAGVLAFHRDTGRIRWEAPLVTSDRIAGVAGRALILAGQGILTALDVNSGKELWSRTPDESADVQAIVVGPDILALAGNRLLRLAAATGAETAVLPLDKTAAVERVLLRDGSLAEIGEEKPSVPPENPTNPQVLLRLPLTETWRLPCEQPDLVWPAPEDGAPNAFAVSSGRLLQCVRTHPRLELAWQRRFRYRPGSIGFHGKRLVTTGNRTVTALDVADGTTAWSLDLSHRADLICGDEQVVVVGQKLSEGKVTAIAAATGQILWSRWFGREIRFYEKPLQWMTLQKDATGASRLRLYLGTSPPGTEEWRMMQVVVDALSGRIVEAGVFLPGETEWPGIIAFGNDRRFSRGGNRPPPWPQQGLFLPEALAYIGKDSIARCVRLPSAADIVPGWTRSMDLKPGSLRLKDVALHPVASGVYVRDPGRIEFFDAAGTNRVAYALPRNKPERTAFDILDFREAGDTVRVVSATTNAPQDRYLWEGIQDFRGTGNVSIRFPGTIQFVHADRKLPEAGANPAATLLNGTVKSSYKGATLTVSNLSSLGWAGRAPKYDVFVYGASGTVSLNDGPEVTCPPADYGRPENRTAFLPNVNVIKFAAVRGDEFSLNLSGTAFSAIQIVRASSRLVNRQQSAIGVNWTGGGPALKAQDVVGADVAHGNWYNISPFNVMSGGPPSSGRPAAGTDSATNAPAGIPDSCVDLFKRETGEWLQTFTLPATPSAAYRSQARILDNALILTDSKGLRVYRPAGK